MVTLCLLGVDGILTMCQRGIHSVHHHHKQGTESSSPKDG